MELHAQFSGRHLFAMKIYVLLFLGTNALGIAAAGGVAQIPMIASESRDFQGLLRTASRSRDEGGAEKHNSSPRFLDRAPRDATCCFKQTSEASTPVPF
jgi:hypothetical protein